MVIETMKIDLKLVFVVLVILCIASEAAGWSRRSGGSRSPSRRGGWGGGRRYSPPRTTRTRWGRTRRYSPPRTTRTRWGRIRRYSPPRTTRTRWGRTRRYSPPRTTRTRWWRTRQKPKPNPKPKTGWWRNGKQKPKPKPKPKTGWWRNGKQKPKPKPKQKAKPKPKTGWWLKGKSKPKPKPKSGKGWWSSSSKSEVKFPHDIKTKSGLNKLLGSEVASVKQVERPLSGFNSKFETPFGKNRQGKHTGVVVTLKNGKQYLIHKGGNFGKTAGGQTIVTDASHMSGKWTTTPGKGTKTVQGKKVTDFIKAGGKTYGVWNKNCQHASDRMYNLGDEQLGKRNMCRG